MKIGNLQINSENKKVNEVINEATKKRIFFVVWLGTHKKS